MALIGKIRKNNWLLILLIGLGLAAFIMMDSMSGDRSIGATSGTTIGNIAGTKISYPDFDRQYQVRSKSFQSNDSYAQRASLWNYLVEKSIIQNESEALGLGVSTQELKDLQFGSPANLSPLMASRFPAGGPQAQFNPNPQPDMERIRQFQKMIEDDEVNGEPLSKDFVDFWSMHEGEVRKERIQSKLNTLVSKSMYNPSWMVEKSYADQNQRITFEYVMLKNINDTDDDARRLVNLISGIPAKINLIPFNPWPESGYERSDWKRIEAFGDIVNKAGYASPIRRPRGEDIMAACGQLKSESQRVRKSAKQMADEVKGQ